VMLNVHTECVKNNGLVLFPFSALMQWNTVRNENIFRTLEIT